MYLAMNRFRIFKGKEDAFETVWRNRDSRLKSVPGFIDFHLMRGPESEEHTLYASHTIWESEDAFIAWTKSEHFRAAHRNAGSNDKLYDGHPKFEGFAPVIGID
ncbi:MAG: antibiotic biosynthesis monooxygenase [Pseudomonadota bacterium]